MDLPDPGSDFAERTISELMLTGQRRELAEAARWLDDDDRQLLSLWWQEATGELTRAELAAALGSGRRTRPSGCSGCGPASTRREALSGRCTPSHAAPGWPACCAAGMAPPIHYGANGQPLGHRRLDAPS